MIGLLEPEVHVWWMSLESRPEAIEQSLGLLSAEEQARAGAYRFPRDRRRFVIARASLRTVLGEYTGEDPGRVPLRLSETGKPSLEDRSDLHFNLSHCEDRGVLAIAKQPIGVDLEKLRFVPDALAIAERLFAASEARALRGFPDELRSEAFLRCWTRKEAYVKGTGGGLLSSLRSFEVSLDEGPPDLVLLDKPEDRGWALHDIAPGPGWTGALAIRSECARLTRRHLQSP